MRIFLSCLLISFLFSCTGEVEEKGSGKIKSISAHPQKAKYERMQNLIREHKSEIFMLVDNSQPEVKRQMTDYLNLCLENDVKGYFSISGKNNAHLNSFSKTIDFFVEKIKEAKAFQPNSEQVPMYNKLRSLLKRDRKIVERYINGRNINYNHTDLQRVRMYRTILDNDISAYQSQVIVTEEEFEKNFNFLIDNWASLSSYY